MYLFHRMFLRRSRRNDTCVNLDYPCFQVKFKAYPGTGGGGGLEFARTIDRVSTDTEPKFVLAARIPDVRLIAEETDLTLMAPYMDAIQAGRGTGTILPETVSEAGGEGEACPGHAAADGLRQRRPGPSRV